MKPNKTFHRDDLCFHSLSERQGMVSASKDMVSPSDGPSSLSDDAMGVIRQTAEDIIEAKRKGASRMLTFGTYLIDNGLGPLVGEFVKRGWLTHLAATGTAVVDDWEFAYDGTACEDSRKTLPEGMFGMWQEPGFYINLAILTGAWKGEGIGESVGRMIEEDAIEVPDLQTLEKDAMSADNPGKASAAIGLLEKMKEYAVASGKIPVLHPYKDSSLLYIARKHGIPFTVHPQFGLDIFYMHPLCSFAAVGRSAETDFLYFVNSVDNLENGIYLSVGSSIASPMIFEKALSMSQNVRIPEGRRMTNHKIVVVDLAESRWDWMANGEPPESRPEYYLRYCKSFSRAKARSMYYVSARDRDFFLHLYRSLNEIDPVG